jgi:hypothetical protein
MNAIIGGSQERDVYIGDNSEILPSTGDCGMTKLELLYAQKSEKLGEVCALNAKSKSPDRR